MVVLVLVEISIGLYAHWLAEGQRHYSRGRLFVQEVVDGWDKNLIQYDPQLSQYDPTLFYTLKPNITNGLFKSGFEIRTLIRTNALGVRDDAASLNHPSVILLGDSFTMGWGVADSACFASVLERKLGQRLLNAGISSFGTAREYELLKRIQYDSCRVLVIQYCVNDQPENTELTAGTFRPSPPERYRAAVHYNALTADYYPFKYCYALLKACVQRLAVHNTTVGRQQPGAKSREVPYEESFFYVIRQIRKLYGGPIVITCLNPNTTGPEVVAGFRSYLASHPMPGIYLADVSALLTADDYFTLDNHINQVGHRKVAQQLEAVIRANRLL